LELTLIQKTNSKKTTHTRKSL